jgi:hypothetical protein
MTFFPHIKNRRDTAHSRYCRRVVLWRNPRYSFGLICCYLELYFLLEFVIEVRRGKLFRYAPRDQQMIVYGEPDADPERTFIRTGLIENREACGQACLGSAASVTTDETRKFIRAFHILFTNLVSHSACFNGEIPSRAARLSDECHVQDHDDDRKAGLEELLENLESAYRLDPQGFDDRDHRLKKNNDERNMKKYPGTQVRGNERANQQKQGRGRFRNPPVVTPGECSGLAVERTHGIFLSGLADVLNKT